MYQRVKETLIHELTHNVFGPHDNNFKNFCSQLTREAREFDWKLTGARRLGDVDAASSDEETWSEDEAMAATRGSSGNSVGGGDLELKKLDPKQAAGAAAAKRASDAAEREMAAAKRWHLARRTQCVRVGRAARMEWWNAGCVSSSCRDKLYLCNNYTFVHRDPVFTYSPSKPQASHTKTSRRVRRETRGARHGNLRPLV